MCAAMVLMSAICIGLGVIPQPLYTLLPFAVDFVPYTGSHVVFHLLLFSALAFFLMLDWPARTQTITLDADWFYRRLGPALVRRLDRGAETIWNGLSKGPLENN
jgi:multicomponent Na+:H+ antiporter subunit D